MAQLHTEIEFRSDEVCEYKTLQRAVFRMAATGVVESRWDEHPPKIDGIIYGGGEAWMKNSFGIGNPHSRLEVHLTFGFEKPEGAIEK